MDEERHARTRDFGWNVRLESFWADVRYALRTLRTSRAFAAVAILTLALGIGANAAIFTVVNALVLRPLPVAEPHRLVFLSSRDTINGGWTAGWDYSVWNEIRQRAESTFDGAVACSAFLQRFNVASSGEMEPVDGIFVSGEFFRILGVPAVRGRTFTAVDDVRGGGPDGAVAVISYGYWQRRFGGAANAIGARLAIEGVPFTVVGVAPAGFFGAEVGRAFDVALPVGTATLVRGDDSDLQSGGAGLYLSVILRLRPEQSMDAANAMLRTMQPQVVAAAFRQEAGDQELHAFRNDPFTVVAAAAGTSELRQQYERPLLILLLIVAAVLLIACANLANLLLARSTARRHEMAVRRALGAPGSRLARQLLIESLVLAAAGAVSGLLVAAWGSRVLVSQLATTLTGAFVLDLSPDWRVLAFTATVTVLTVALFGTAPALRAARASPMDALKGRGFRESHRQGPGRAVSKGFAIAQVTLSLVLLVAAGLLVQTFHRLASVPLGFDSDRVLVVSVNATRAVVNPADRLSFYQRLTEMVSNIPGVAHAAASPATPFYGGPMPMAAVRVDNGAAIGERVHPIVHVISPGWFATYGTAIHTGRSFDARDTHNGLPVVIVNDAFVRRYLSGRNALGRTVSANGPPGRAPKTRTVVGIAQDAVYFGRRGGSQPTIYHPLAQWDQSPPPPEISLSIRSAAGPPALLGPAVAAALTQVDRNLSFSFRPLVDQVNSSHAQERLVALLSGSFAVLALLLAGVGLYGVTSYVAIQRQAEIGIRVALGARRSEVIGLVLRQALVLTAIGTTIGLATAAAVTRYLDAMLFGLTPLDPATFMAVPLIFVAIVMAAAYIPARRATTVDPLVALRCE